MMRLVILGTILVMSAPGHAGGVYKCKLNGKTIYQEQPCPNGNGEEVAIIDDGPDELERLRAENRALREAQAYDSGAYSRAVEANNSSWREVNRQHYEYRKNSEKSDRCMELSRRSADMSISSNERAEANYQSSKMRCH